MKPKDAGLTPDDVLRDMRQLALAYQQEQRPAYRAVFFLNPLAYDTLMQHEFVITADVSGTADVSASEMASVYGLPVKRVPDQSPELGDAMMTLREVQS